MSVRSSWLFAAVLVGASGCGRVVFDDDADVESSSSTPSAVGAGGADPSTGIAVGSGAGGAPTGGVTTGGVTTGGVTTGGVTTGGAGGADVGTGGGGEGGAPPSEVVEVCDALVWQSGSLDQGPYDDEVAEVSRLRATSGGGASITWATRSAGGSEVRVRNKAIGHDVWSGPLTWSQNGHAGFNHPITPAAAARPSLASARVSGAAYAVQTASGGSRLFEQGALLTALPEEWGPVHALAATGAGYAAVHGTGGRLSLGLVDTAGGTSLPDELGCSDGAPAAAAATTPDGRAVAVVATAPGVCEATPFGAATSARVALVGDVDDTTTLTIDVGTPISDVLVAPRIDGATVIGVRTDGGATLRTYLLDASGAVTPGLVVDTSGDREVAIAARLRDLVVVDTGAATDTTPSLRVRVLDEVGTVVSEAQTHPALGGRTMVGEPSVLVAPDAGSIAIATIGATAEGSILGVVRADCVAAGGR